MSAPPGDEPVQGGAQPQRARPTASPNAVVSGILGSLGFVIALAAGRTGLTILLGIAALVCSIVGLARNEPRRWVAALGLITALFTLL